MSANPSGHRIRVGISVGDLNGVGMEVVLKTLSDKRLNELMTPVIFGSSSVLSFYRKQLDLKELPVRVIKDWSEVKNDQANLFDCISDQPKIELGKSTPEGGQYALKSLQAAADALEAGHVQALVTAPIDKHNIQSDDFKFPGHTEYLGQKFGGGQSLMILCRDAFRVALVTGHIALSQVESQITSQSIGAKLRLFEQSLRLDFEIRKPRIAVLGLNPHAGDQGLIGDAESKIIEPTVRKHFDEGLMVYGPYAADGFFGAQKHLEFDGVLAMYHDQGLIPFKALNFGGGINFTAGLPVVRTSPDHGTAYDIAGKGIANEESFREALYLAKDVYVRRQRHAEAAKNPLIKQEESK
ncbi:4-hydroxythreonine-4-phosphate dehydrogenase PdxA [Cryomorphaceae bacterium]|nr:4-hydroxythreonine-4-phosphate dehydrogenase PdxA [Cryomorphaceae bacterium]